ncbi:formylglycine-generating enzyme family protein [Parendozoicomonas haliclonae]|uniref:Iron(II)-dependent oxidoreductase EgtB n=1 Tax=Parendozoicomonas haliclonae TaxID=1960125 RepID=A0A1X7AJS3_9GAMM|nr:formylglycine-generating enzyme family protein [Parendozoicomonas haliclonae]SMA47080.1 Iron(II)-dependent oxidoreductase EgtB [Parendozoicomonas haliclonae]
MNTIIKQVLLLIAGIGLSVSVLAANATNDAAMVTVPAGQFWMGCEKSIDPDCHATERPAHAVWVRKFKIDKYEVNYRRFEECIEAGDCEPLGIGGGCNFGWEGREQLPVNCVTWKNADNFCKYDGKRLPTEAEWEKAARANTFSLYPWGNSAPSCDKAVIDNPNGGNLGCGKGVPHDVGSKPKGASPYGAMDMAGSMWEWTADWYDPFYYNYSSYSNPKGPKQGEYKTARGGDLYARKAAELRTVTRFPYAYGNYSPAVGFRCAM